MTGHVRPKEEGEEKKKQTPVGQTAESDETSHPPDSTRLLVWSTGEDGHNTYGTLKCISKTSHRHGGNSVTRLGAVGAVVGSVQVLLDHETLRLDFNMASTLQRHRHNYVPEYPGQETWEDVVGTYCSNGQPVDRSSNSCAPLSRFSTD